MKKKVFVAILALTMAVGIAGCGGTEKTYTADPLTDNDLYMSFLNSGEMALGIGVTRGEVEEAFGATSDAIEELSGGEITLIFAPPSLEDAMEITEAGLAAGKPDEEIREAEEAIGTLRNAYIEDDGLETMRGIRVGSTEEEVLEAYGEPGEEKTSESGKKDGVFFVYRTPDGDEMLFKVRNGTVSMVVLQAAKEA